MRVAPLLSTALLLGACAVGDPNAPPMSSEEPPIESSQLGPKSYLLVATGSGGMPSGKVEERFAARARELCGGEWFSLDSTIYPVGSTSTAAGPFVFVPRTVFRMRGTVTCK